MSTTTRVEGQLNAREAFVKPKAKEVSKPDFSKRAKVWDRVVAIFKVVLNTLRGRSVSRSSLKKANETQSIKAFLDRFTLEFDGAFAHQANIEAILTANSGTVELLEDLLGAFRSKLGSNVYFELDVRHPNDPHEPLTLSIRLKRPLDGQHKLRDLIKSVCKPFEDRIMAVEPGLDVMRGSGKPKRRFG